MLKLYILLLLTLSLNAIRDDPKHWGQGQQVEGVAAQRQEWFNQTVDHFNYQAVETFKQRYWVFDTYFNANVGPVFLYICGQYVCPGVPSDRQWVVTLAERLQGLILVLEHRYYGKSMPFGDKSLETENLVLLNSQQALMDLAFFMETMKANHTYGISDKNKWITVGGSYPGALSAWFRYKYPHLTVGSIASSAVIEAIQDFKDFDEQIYSSSMLSGDFCAKALNDSRVQVEEILDSSQGDQFKQQFKGADKLSDNQFMFFWVDTIVGVIQYGGRTKLCSDLKGKSEKDQFAYLINLAKQTNEVYEYGAFYLSNVTFAMQNGQGSRSWTYQCCSEYGFWQTPSAQHPMRSSRLNLDFYHNLCKQVFGDIKQKIFRKNVEYGGLDERSFNLFMVNGVEDPWRWASLQQSKGNIISRVANCTNCAHCAELYTPKSTDAPELKKIRDEQYLTIMEWLESKQTPAHHHAWKSLRRNI